MNWQLYRSSLGEALSLRRLDWRRRPYFLWPPLSRRGPPFPWQRMLEDQIRNSSAAPGSRRLAGGPMAEPGTGGIPPAGPQASPSGDALLPPCRAALPAGVPGRHDLGGHRCDRAGPTRPNRVMGHRQASRSAEPGTPSPVQPRRSSNSAGCDRHWSPTGWPSCPDRSLCLPVRPELRRCNGPTRSMSLSFGESPVVSAAWVRTVLGPRPRSCAPLRSSAPCALPPTSAWGSRSSTACTRP